ncbi:hypothetical protein [Algoriphagus boritolerans]|uniref:hypothetical protein n=1 Tax=Algoriphagus boritolerans TaxID=308111 RepID=UPI000A5FDB8B
MAPIRSELEFGFSGITGDKSKRYGKAQSLAVKKATLSDNGEPVLDPEKNSNLDWRSVASRRRSGLMGKCQYDSIDLET